MEIQFRQKYIDQIEKHLGKDYIIVLVGQRRVGKSYTLKMIRSLKEKDERNNIIYIDKDGYTLIHQRMEKDIWQHLWEFALIADDSKPAKPVKQPEGRSQLTLTHVLSHQRLHARFEVCRCDELPLMDGMVRVGWKELENYAFSRLTLRALAGFGL